MRPFIVHCAVDCRAYVCALRLRVYNHRASFCAMGGVISDQRIASDQMMTSDWAAAEHMTEPLYARHPTSIQRHRRDNGSHSLRERRESAPRTRKIDGKVVLFQLSLRVQSTKTKAAGFASRNPSAKSNDEQPPSSDAGRLTLVRRGKVPAGNDWVPLHHLGGRRLLGCIRPNRSSLTTGSESLANGNTVTGRCRLCWRLVVLVWLIWENGRIRQLRALWCQV